MAVTQTCLRMEVTLLHLSSTTNSWSVQQHSLWHLQIQNFERGSSESLWRHDTEKMRRCLLQTLAAARFICVVAFKEFACVYWSFSFMRSLVLVFESGVSISLSWSLGTVKMSAARESLRILGDSPRSYRAVHCGQCVWRIDKDSLSGSLIWLALNQIAENTKIPEGIPEGIPGPEGIY